MKDVDEVAEVEQEDIPSVCQDDKSLVMIQPKHHMVEHGETEEEAMYIMHDSPLGEIQMEAHIDPVMDMWLTLGSTIEEEQLDAQASSTVITVADPYSLEMLEVDGIIP